VMYHPGFDLTEGVESDNESFLKQAFD